MKQSVPPPKKIAAIALILISLSGGVVVAANVTWFSPSSTTSTYDAPSGPIVTEATEISPSSQVPVRDGIVDFGIVDFRGPGGSEARITSIDGSGITLSNIDANGGTLIVNHSAQRVDVSGGISSMSFSQVDVASSSTEISITGGSGTVGIHGLQASEDYVVVRENSSDTIETTDASGVLSVSVSSGDAISITSTSAPETSNLSPNGTDVSTTPVTLNVSIADEDFATSTGDSVSVEFYDASDDSLIGTDTVSSNGTASTDWSNVVGGQNSWYVVASDDYGDSAQSSTASFGAPDTLEIHNESSGALLDTVSVEIRFYYGTEQGEIVERSTSNGTIDMEGLPVDESFIVTANADGYLQRRIFVPSLTESGEIYLLPKDADYRETVFELEDLTGDYPPSRSVLLVERNINGNWSSVQGDFFGATGDWTAQLSYNRRHRMTIHNVETGESRYLGTFTPTTSGVRTVQVSASDTILVEEIQPTISVSPSIQRLPSMNNTTVGASLKQRDVEIAEWSLNIVYTNKTTEEVLLNRTGTGGFDISTDVDLEGRSGGYVLIEVEYANADNEGGAETFEMPVRKDWGNPFGLVPLMGTFVDRLGAEQGGSVLSMIAFVGTLAATTGAALRLRASSVTLGLVAVGTLGVFSIIGFIGWPVVFVSGVAWLAMFVIAGRRY